MIVTLQICQTLKKYTTTVVHSSLVYNKTESIGLAQLKKKKKEESWGA